MEVSRDLPNLPRGATSLLDVIVTGRRQGDLAYAALTSATRLIEFDPAAWSNNTVRVMARNVSNTTIDLAAATLSVQVTKRRIPDGKGRRGVVLEYEDQSQSLGVTNL